MSDDTTPRHDDDWVPSWAAPEPEPQEGPVEAAAPAEGEPAASTVETAPGTGEAPVTTSAFSWPEPTGDPVAAEPTYSSTEQAIPPPPLAGDTGGPTTDTELFDPQLPDSPALIPPPSHRSDGGDVYRGGDYGREGPAARPPRTAYGSPLPASTIESKPKKARLSKWSSIVLPFLAGAVGAGLVLGGFLLLRDDESTTTEAPPAAAEPVTIRETIRTEFIGPDGAVADPTAVARKVIPSVVTVEVGISDADGGVNGTGSGSGVVLTADGYIVTNEHVVDGADVVTVSFSDGRLYQAELLGADALTDLAVLRIDAEGLIPIEIGSTAELQIGDAAIAAGSPLGLVGGPTVTVGVISAFDREVQTGPGVTDRLLGMLQTDAPITRGSSGGALVDSRGALIGVTSAVGVSDVGVEGIGFAIPIEVVQRITDELIARGEVTHSFLGIEGRTSFEEQFDGAELAVGVFIQAIVEDTGAAAAGLQEGDVITAIEGAPVKTINSLVGRLRRYAVGESLDLQVMRAGESITLSIELGPRPEDV